MSLRFVHLRIAIHMCIDTSDWMLPRAVELVDQLLKPEQSFVIVGTDRMFWEYGCPSNADDFLYYSIQLHNLLYHLYHFMSSLIPVI